MISQALSPPYLLQQIPLPPRTIHIKGQYEEARTAVAIVGSRKASREGEEIAYRLAGELAGAGISIISGLARGIDSAAHKGALARGGHTVAVLPSGIENVYPSSNYYLAQEILKSGGALISEIKGKYQPKKHDFLKRNRIISGLSKAVILVEATARSGALNTARHALEQDREVIAVPGSILSPGSYGCNELIRQGATPLIEISDIFNILEIDTNTKQSVEIIDVSSREKMILDALGHRVISPEVLQQELKLELPTIQRAISTLEIEGHIRRIPGNLLCRR